MHNFGGHSHCLSNEFGMVLDVVEVLFAANVASGTVPDDRLGFFRSRLAVIFDADVLWGSDHCRTCSAHVPIPHLSLVWRM